MKIFIYVSENELFFRLKDLIKDLEKTEDQYGIIDCHSNQYELCLEMKCRNKHYDDLIIEKSKYDELMLCKRTRYVCSTPEGIFSFNLKKIPEPKWYYVYLPWHTEFNDNYKKMKVVGYIPITLAKKIG